MLKIGTHDSATGEKPANLISWLLIPFARTQRKTIKEQYEAGCRMFDIRINKYKDEWHCAHGLFFTERTAEDIFKELNSFEDSIYVCITYEGKLKNDKEKKDFLDKINILKNTYSHINYGPVAVKYTNDDLIVDWENLLPADNWYKNEQAFLPLNGHTWHIILPIPKLWWFIYNRKPKFNNEYFKFVDFL